MPITLKEAMSKMPLVAILRGVTPAEVLDVADILVTAGYRVIEVPLNSPSPYESIKLLSDRYGNDVIIGAGTVVSQEQVDLVEAAGGRIIISPHADAKLIRYSKAKDLYCVPGFFTPSDAYAAINAGADSLKLFPADAFGPMGLKAMSVVLPDIDILPVGGVSPDTMQAFIDAGASGFGLGSGLYKAGMSVEQVKHNALAYVQGYKSTLTAH
ncbi:MULTISPECIES: 2-dehydro-3-deoxy-6-phosphogalactonate aldolase [unclassified Shewanella]|uniref:2-dehydro-3-deoxy-6-phosphogalactonate aldolase n=1 Tax=unclassified Shewanella TaxID=196818 RepID=UPI000C81C530|nr:MULTISPECIES: 2-dehydro-3-deoxy-6-phosphogalactonate aldolase [unclassified Shewanella]MDO6680108.1 2-dehydro-3-deoxy-6-phosphogalactonate aldolase [Shewanella sp. 4_MG-2023]MDO6777006.1 2-dehydro-3-deoxy-6-phosphogalactonate aldolase [Shewanella sp. 3_MG-2023]PMG28338.1 2-dehydro-3-deoxy-6-phosphogalactonate aldolase [Shewanella sp. 10N.286.52.C2]PMG40111.1 2-dehydro-3-deoxy-6-phosphogalactonate aldolase [Shewanella sp. 10N.286.52.B9]